MGAFLYPVGGHRSVRKVPVTRFGYADTTSAVSPLLGRLRASQSKWPIIDILHVSVYDGTMNYERVRFNGRTVLLLVEGESGEFLIGQEVDRSGTPVGRQHLIDVSLVTRRTPLRMNRHYGELEDQ